MRLCRPGQSIASFSAGVTSTTSNKTDNRTIQWYLHRRWKVTVGAVPASYLHSTNMLTPIVGLFCTNLGTREVACGGALHAFLELLAHLLRAALGVHLSVDLGFHTLRLGLRPWPGFDVISHGAASSLNGTALLKNSDTEYQRFVLGINCAVCSVCGQLLPAPGYAKSRTLRKPVCVDWVRLNITLCHLTII